MFFHGVGFRLRTVKAMACGSVVQSAHVPIYEQLLSRNGFRQFLGACNASMLALLRVGVCHKRCIFCYCFCVVLSQVISRPWHQAHLKKCRERWIFGEAFPRSLHPSLGPWVSSLRAAYWQSSTWSTGSFQSKHFRRVNLRACEVEIPLFICLAQHSRREQGSWYGGVCTTVAGWRASTASATGQLRIKTPMDFFASKTFNCQWFQWQVIQGVIA